MTINTHLGWKDADIKTSIARCCYNCNGIQVILIKNKKKEYLYYQVGSTDASKNPFECISNEKIDQSSCIHKWITLLSDVIDDKVQAEKKYRKYIREEFPYFPERYIFDNPALTDVYERKAYGESDEWCWICGLFYNPTGRPSFLLPEKGYYES